MADAHGAKDSPLKTRLLSQGERFSFSQAYRLLRLLPRPASSPEPDVRVRPHLSLDFPGTDLNKIREPIPGQYRLTANFLGLYGVTSPLPNFYTEDLLDERHDGRHSNRDFLDIIGQTLYPLFFRAWLKSRAHIRIKEFGDDRLLEIFHTFVGICRPLDYLSRPGVSHLLRFAGLFSQYPRSAMGLQTIIAALYPDTQVEVVQQDLRKQPIPSLQQMSLGQQNCTLGDDAHLGSEIRCRTSNLTLRISNIDEALFTRLLPGGAAYNELQFLVRYYLVTPLHIRLELRPAPDVVGPLHLGVKAWGSLGRNSWLPAWDGHCYQALILTL
ncbi:type VI secretion system baseplate subunit TssG [Castellaniella sp.]|uniref:type VI secretion system baseplate subunit TssG n=1 Tax=Castellaniella sp. TaxID=1955812 RepID=UPI002AFE63FF|nr:type VI secretion system baseplate subunit TssG [Castellaniella sp.]